MWIGLTVSASVAVVVLAGGWWARRLRLRARLLRFADRVDAAWCDTEAGIDLEMAGHERLDLDPAQRERLRAACAAVFAAGQKEGVS